MKEVPLPTEGQFVCVWEYDGELWCETVRVVDTGYECYDAVHDVWVPDLFSAAYGVGVRFFTKEK